MDIQAQGSGSRDEPRKAALRRRNKRLITKRQKDKFFEALNETCNVTIAVEESGISSTHAYRLRQTDPKFAEAWDAAITDAVRRLEWTLLQRAIEGDEKPIIHGGEIKGKYRDYPDRIALGLLTRHGSGAAAGASGGSSLNKLREVQERRAQLKAKLETELHDVAAKMGRGGPESQASQTDG